jgi:hypothetical protein
MQTIIQKLNLEILSHYQNQQDFVMMLISIWEILLSYDKIGVKTWIGGLFGLSHFFWITYNVKFKAIFKINIVNFLIIHVVIDFNRNHYKNIGWIQRR